MNNLELEALNRPLSEINRRGCKRFVPMQVICPACEHEFNFYDLQLS